jgi:YbbR domain-containing protein
VIALLRNLLLKDLGLKLFSLAMALLMYWTISLVANKNEVGPLSSLAMAVDVRTFYKLPVLILSSAADARRFKVVPETVDVTVQGDPRILAGLASSEIRVLVDLSGIESAAGMRKRVEVSTPAGVINARVVPSEVRVIFPKDR